MLHQRFPPSSSFRSPMLECALKYNIILLLTNPSEKSEDPTLMKIKFLRNNRIKITINTSPCPALRSFARSLDRSITFEQSA